MRTVTIKSENFLISAKYNDAKLFEEIVKRMKLSMGFKAESRFSKVGENKFMISFTNFEGNEYHPLELRDLSKKLYDFGQIVIGTLKHKIKLLQAGFGLTPDDQEYADAEFARVYAKCFEETCKDFGHKPTHNPFHKLENISNC